MSDTALEAALRTKALEAAAHDAELTTRVETGVERLEKLPDPHAKETAREALAALLALHREGLARVLERLPAVQLEALSSEPLVSSLLLLHDLHPADLGARVKRAVEKVRPLLALNGASVMLEDEGGDVRATLWLKAGCGSTGARLRTLLAQALDEAAPDARSIRIEERGT
jgi:hypothetical protein